MGMQLSCLAHMKEKGEEKKGKCAEGKNDAA